MTLTKNFLFVFALAAILLASCHRNSGMHFNVQDYGARNDKSVLSTKAIQKAIDAAYDAGGGKVYFPPGEYLSGTIVLKSNVILYLEAGATLFASQDTIDFKNDFKVIKSNDSGKPGVGETPVFIYARKADNIGIMGKGTIHGQAQRTWEDLHEVDGFIAWETENARLAGIEMKRFYKVHPYICLVFLEECENVTISDVSLIESTDWTLHFKWCNRVFVDNVYIESSLDAGVNSDGIDIDGCTDVVVSNCIIITGDDAIVLKSTMTYPDFRNCENITVTNCVLTSTSTGLKIGTESHGDFRNINFNNCVITNSNRGLSIVIRDGGTAENVVFSDIIIETNRKHFNWWGNGDPVWLVLKKRNPESKLGMIRNISFNNIIAHGQGTSKVEGFPGQPLENILFNNVQLHMYPESLPDKRADDAFFATEVTGLTLENVSVTWNGEPEPAWRHAFSFANIHRLHLNGLQGIQAPTSKGAFISVRDVEDALIERCWPLKGTIEFLKMDGSGNRSIVLNQNHLQGVKAH
jgi:polygalacturonase